MMDVSGALLHIVCIGVRCDTDGCECNLEGKGCVYNELNMRKLVGIARRKFAIKEMEYYNNKARLCQLNEAMAIIDKDHPRKGVVL